MSALELRNISKHFGAIQALNNVSLTIEPGEVVGLMGDNGAGKSTMVKVIAGNFAPSSGDIFINGSKVHFHKPLDAQKAGIEVVYQDLAICNNLSAASNVFLGREPTRSFGPILRRRLRHDEKPGERAFRASEIRDAAARSGQKDVRRPASGRRDRPLTAHRSPHHPDG